jgi:Kef-type K+ transport system membrane component KefB/voltage-gated potassium channel Kch
MTDLPILRDLGYVVIAATLFVLFGRRINAPTIVSYILAGLALGPVTGLLAATESMDLIAEVGIALLLFLVGLELSLDKIKVVGRVAVVAGLGQVVFTALGGIGLSLLLGFGVIEAVFIGVALTFSSTVVVVKLLTQKEELDTQYGRIAVGIFLVQDLVVIVVLTFLTGLGQPGALTTVGVLTGLGIAFGGMLLMLAVALLAAWYVLPRLFGWVAGSQAALFIWSLSWCFLFVAFAEVFHLSAEIGAFLAGVSLAQLPYNHDLRRRVSPLMNFFVAVFFVTLGVRMELGNALEHWGAAAVFSLFVLIGNPLIFMWIIARMGYGERTAFLTSVTVAQISEFSFIFAAVGLASGLIGEAVMSIVAVVGLVTIAASAYMILYNHQLYALMKRLGLLRMFGAAEEPELIRSHDDLGGHVIVVGMNSLGRRLVRELGGRGEQVLAVDVSPRNLEGLPSLTLMGNAEDVAVLQTAGLPRAKLLVSALQIEETNTLLAYWGKSYGVPTSIHAFDASIFEELRDAGAGHLIVSKSSGTRRTARTLREMGLFG